jgi:hypothetical protein
MGQLQVDDVEGFLVGIDGIVDGEGLDGVDDVVVRVMIAVSV